MADVIEKQREALVTSIKAAEAKEVQRLKRLAAVKNARDHKELLSRYQGERERDKELIERLSNDFFQLKKSHEEGALAEFVDRRNAYKQQTMRPGDAQQRANEQRNRFAGLENHDKELLHADMIKKFDHYDHRAEARKNAKPYNPIEETKRMRLLTEKRDLLKQLISVQCAESNAQGTSTSRAYTGRNIGDNYSVASGATGMSSLSHATFASRSAPSVPHSVPRVNIPKLNLA